MTFKEWWHWFRKAPLFKKWFIWLILLRPIIDNFYELKETSALASPLYIVGFLTPVLILMSTISNGFPSTHSTIEDVPFRIWSVLLVFNAATFWFIDLSVVAFGDLIKYTTPIFLFFYARRIVQNKDDLHGILTTFLVSCLFPFGIFLYEAIFNPIAIEYISQGRGGGSRIRGAYADIMNYAIYFILFLIIVSYYFLEDLYEGRIRIKVKAWHLIIAIAFVLYGLTRIRHVSTWGVFIALVLVFLFHNLRNTKGLFFVLLFVAIVSTFFAQDIYIDHIEPLIGKELMVVEGESESNQAFNGRMTRWEKYFEVWEQMPAYNHFFGIVTANFKETVVMIGGGMHSDYVRQLFLTGFVGLFFWVVFLLAALARWFRLFMPEKYLIAATIAAMLMWSITTVPTLYAPLLYIVFPIIAYCLLPKERQTRFT
jgi:O-antigen ligase